MSSSPLPSRRTALLRYAPLSLVVACSVLCLVGTPAVAGRPLVGRATSEALSPDIAARAVLGSHRQFLPAGFQGVVWGANDRSIPALRGRPMELQTTPDPQVVVLIEAPIPGAESKEDVGVVKYHLWRGQMFLVQQYLPGELTMKEGHELVVRFEERYGKGEHKVVYTKERTASGYSGTREDLEQWFWQDDFTVQSLTRQVLTNQWTIERRSLLLEASRAVQEQQSREEVRSSRVKAVSID